MFKGYGKEKDIQQFPRIWSVLSVLKPTAFLTWHYVKTHLSLTPGKIQYHLNDLGGKTFFFNTSLLKEQLDI